MRDDIYPVMAEKVPKQKPANTGGAPMEPVVSLRDIFQKLESVSRDVGDIRADTGVMREQLSTVTDRTVDHEDRIREAEKVIQEVSDHPLRLSNVEQISNSVKDNPERIRSLEKRVWAIPSAATIIALVALAITIWKMVRGG